jgi:hypothetical protein
MKQQCFEKYPIENIHLPIESYSCKKKENPDIGD